MPDFDQVLQGIAMRTGFKGRTITSAFDYIRQGTHTTGDHTDLTFPEADGPFAVDGKLIAKTSIGDKL